MKVLVTGGTGVVGVAAVKELLDRGHQVRLFSRNAIDDSRQFGSNVEAVNGSVADASTVQGVAEGCDVVLHVAGIVSEKPPEVTFQRVNVEGTRNLVTEAERAGSIRFIYVSSLGAERGQSDYHRSKLMAEEIVRTFPGQWLILRPGNVFGPGDEVVSMVMKMMRTLPAVPVLDLEGNPSQPIWAYDLAKALALAVERDDVEGQILPMAGSEQITMNEMLDRVGRVVGKEPMRLPVPNWLASFGTDFLNNVGQRVGFDLPFTPDQMTMLLEGNRIQPGEANALVEVFGIQPTPLDEALRQLAVEMPEQLPTDGQGALHYAEHRGLIVGTDVMPQEMFEKFRVNFSRYFGDTMVEPNPEPRPEQELAEGATMTLALPLRGNVQVRVAEVTDRSATLLTVEGHPLAGAVKFRFEEHAEMRAFCVITITRPATLTDAAGMAMGGQMVQTATWDQFVRSVVEDFGMLGGSVMHTSDYPQGEEAERMERWIEGMSLKLKRDGPEESRATAL
jgi:nucleoside-diphosphate-sugar epimerase